MAQPVAKFSFASNGSTQSSSAQAHSHSHDGPDHHSHDHDHDHGHHVHDAAIEHGHTHEIMENAGQSKLLTEREGYKLMKYQVNTLSGTCPISLGGIGTSGPSRLGLEGKSLLP